MSRDEAGMAALPLREEQAALEPVLRGITALVARFRAGRHLHPALLAGALTCLETFQRCHDAKIEAALLPVLLRNGAIGPALVDELTHEHREGRQRVRAVRRLLTGSGRLSEAIGRVASDAVAFLQTHAVHEAEALFAVADRVLSGDDAVALWEAFRQIDAREIPPGEREVLQALTAAIDPARNPAGSPPTDQGGIVAAHLMRSRPRAARPADTLARAAELMDRTGVRELPVVENGGLCGIISRTDLQAHLGHLEWTTVDAAMTREPVVVTPDQSASAVSRLLLQGRFNAVPVVAAESTLVGMLSRSDLLAAVADEDAAAASGRARAAGSSTG
jgi:CBS domain-containing protein